MSYSREDVVALCDVANMKVLNDSDAAKFLTKEYRAGWELPA